MLTISAQEITEEDVVKYEIGCDAVDYAAIYAAKQRHSESFEGCNQVPEYAVLFGPAEDMVIPHFLCALHLAALKLSLHEGIAIDEDLIRKFSN